MFNNIKMAANPLPHYHQNEFVFVFITFIFLIKNPAFIFLIKIHVFFIEPNMDTKSGEIVIMENNALKK